MGTTNAKGSNYAWAIAIACIAFYAVPLGFMANHAGLFLTPVINEFGWSQTEASLYMSIQPWVAAICTPIAWQAALQIQPALDHDRCRSGVLAVVFGLRLVHRAMAVASLRRSLRCLRSVLDVYRHADYG